MISVVKESMVVSLSSHWNWIERPPTSVSFDLQNISNDSIFSSWFPLFSYSISFWNSYYELCKFDLFLQDLKQISKFQIPNIIHTNFLSYFLLLRLILLIWVECLCNTKQGSDLRQIHNWPSGLKNEIDIFLFRTTIDVYKIEPDVYTKDYFKI